MRISIAMATYNGAKYLPAQLDSLVAQKQLPYELVICDDGSTDDTLDIISEFSRRSPFPVRVYQNERNLGFAKNFLKTARQCKGDWIAFCDQDDVWLPNKIGNAYTAILKDPRPKMILQNAYLSTTDLSYRGRRFPNRIRSGFHRPRSQFGFWVWLGFLQTFHASLLDFLDEDNLPINYFPGHATMSHDKWTCMIANATGGIRVLGEPVALYRRHENALTGAYEKQSLKDRVDKALPVSSDHYNFLAEVAVEMANYLLPMASRVQDDRADDLRCAANGFFQMAKLQTLRADLYDSENWFHRALCFMKTLVLGGYVGPPMKSLGWKSALKDLLRVCGIIRATKQSK